MIGPMQLPTEVAARGDPNAPRYAGPAFAVLVVCFWVALTGLISSAQYSDSIEQYNWAHSLQLGYWKHPPLATWLMRAAISLFGASGITSLLLAALCYGGTAFFTWKLAGLLLDRRAATLAVLLWPLHHAFSWRAQLYNHNTVLVLVVSALAWAGVRAARGDARAPWLLAGALAGLALLTKYQAIVPIAGVVFGLWHTGALRTPVGRRNFGYAAAVAALVFAPHAVWALEHGVPTLAYVQRSAPVLEGGARLLALPKFFASQISLYFSMLVVAAAFAVWPSRDRGPDSSPARAAASGPDASRWLLALVAMPLLLVCVTLVLLGIKPQKYWGLQTLQFFPVLLAWWLCRLRPQRSLLLPAVLAAAISAGGGIYFALEASNPAALRKLHSMDRIWPGRALAQAVVADWKSVTACPLKYVVGPGFAAGLVSVYSGQYPVVLEDGDYRKSPWVDRADLERSGAVLIGKPLPGGETPPAGSRFLVFRPASNSPATRPCTGMCCRRAKPVRHLRRGRKEPGARVGARLPQQFVRPYGR
jgi:4-amino-4-deoxy-L-arabinose transferase-like glycosyltransferase